LRNKELVVIAGPTGVGKTDLGIKIAREIGTEIISADSRQIYKELRIGTAVPTYDQLREIKHHFIHIIGIRDYYNASIYERQVLDRLELLFQKYDKVILLGGTGLYINAVLEGIDDLPDADLELRKKLQDRIKKEGLESLRFELKKLDPVSYHSIDLKNPKRVQKALEVTMITGRPYSEFLKRSKKLRNFKTRLIALNLDRQELYARINMRTDKMIEQGWVEETHALLEHRHTNALNTVGYKELFAYLDGLCTLDAAVEKIKANTRKYARKQITWFRKNEEYKWFYPSEVDQILKYIDYE
jgi:tRNA dimethylallyltransferase